jgi:hypothetical protein
MYKLFGIDEMTGQPYKRVFRLTDNTTIPFDENNTDYRNYLKWLAEGNTPLPADE